MANAPVEDFLVRGIWKVELAFKPNPAERTFYYTFWIAMTKGQGCCYCTGDDPRGRELVGSDARELVKEKTCISIATLDSLYASLPRQPVAVHELRGTRLRRPRRGRASFLWRRSGCWPAFPAGAAGW